MLSVEAVDLYYGASHALRRVSLTARKGAVTCILGRNGVGKTSLLRAIVGLNPIRSGHIRWEDRELTQLPTHQRARAGLGLVPQGREIFPRLSVLENLMTGFATLPRHLRHIPDDIFALFPVLKDMLNRRGGDLSGGQQQQLAIARALVAEPKLILADEPTGNLDTENGTAVMSLLTEINGAGTTVVMVTHSLVHAGYAKRTVKLLDGRVVSETQLAA